MVRTTELCVQGLGNSEGRGNMKNHLVSTCLAPALVYICGIISHPLVGCHWALTTQTSVSWPSLQREDPPSSCGSDPGTSPGREKIHLHSLAPPLSLRNPFSAAPPGSALCSRARRSASGACYRASLADDGVQQSEAHLPFSTVSFK